MRMPHFVHDEKIVLAGTKADVEALDCGYVQPGFLQWLQWSTSCSLSLLGDAEGCSSAAVVGANHHCAEPRLILPLET